MKGRDLVIMAGAGLLAYTAYKKISSLGGSFSDLLNPQNWQQAAQDAISGVVSPVQEAYSDADSYISNVLTPQYAAADYPQGAPTSNVLWNFFIDNVVPSLPSTPESENLIYSVQGALLGIPTPPSSGSAPLSPVQPSEPVPVAYPSAIDYFWGIYATSWQPGVDPLTTGYNWQDFPSQYMKDIFAGKIAPLTQAGADAFQRLFMTASPLQPDGTTPSYNLYLQNLI